MNKLDQLHWPLIISMGALALVRPFLTVTGIIDVFGRLSSPFWVTVLISAAWLAIVVMNKVRAPVLTLMLTGGAYGVFTILISAIFSTVLGGELGGPLTNSFALAYVLLINTIWGLVVGVMAWALQRKNRPVTQ